MSSYRSLIPWHTGPSVKVVVVCAVLLVGTVFLGIRATSAPPTCGSQIMKPSDTCMVNGSPTSYEQVASAPITQWWLWALVALVLVAVIGWQFRPAATPTPEQRQQFEANVNAFWAKFNGANTLIAGDAEVRSEIEADIAALRQKYGLNDSDGPSA